MNNIRKIQAFTLHEMLVVLLITVIVVGMAFSVLNLVQRQMHGIDRNFERNTELNLLRQSLWIDLNQANSVWYDQKKDELFLENGLKDIRYEFKQDFVVKALDTFHLQFESKTFLFLGDYTKEGEIDALDFKTSEKNGSQKLFIYKKNAATSYLNN